MKIEWDGQAGLIADGEGKGSVNGEVCHRFETHHPLSSVFKLTSSLPLTLSKGASKLLHLVESFTRLFSYSRYSLLYVTFDHIFATEYGL